METKRCPRCNKLLRANAESCTRCGIALPTSKGAKKLATNWNDSTKMSSQPTNPLASPHRAGHYSGFHPEDQPFQSSFFLRVKRPSMPLPAPPLDDETRESAVEQPETLWQEMPPIPALRANRPDQDSRDLADLPTLHSRARTRSSIRPTPSRSRTRVVPILVTAALLSFLIASSLLTFLLLGKTPAKSAGPQLQAMPGMLRVGDELQLTGMGFRIHSTITLTRDTQITLLNAQGSLTATTDGQGNFQAHVPITAAWSVGIHTLHATDAAKNSASASITIEAPVAGPPQLHLDTTHLDLGAGNPGSTSNTNMTLTNTGGEQVSWQAQSSVNWLSLNPSSGTFDGSTLVVLTVHRTNLAPQAYLGQVTFTQNQGASQTLYVSMTVNTQPANLNLSTASLAFVGTPIQSPAGQTMIIQNMGGQALNWVAGSTTTDGNSWLSVSPASGQLDANTSAVLTVNANTLKMAPGSYQGSLSFSYEGGSAQEVAVILTVNPPPQPAIHVTPTSLSFTTNQGFNPAPQSFSLSNPGNGPLNWAIQEDVNGQLYLRVSSTHGSLAAGQSINITVTPTLGSASGPINSTLTIVDTDPGTNVTSQQVQVSVAITSEPVITLLTGNLEFDHSSTTTDTSLLVIFSNSGSLPLNWAITTSANVPWLSFDVNSGTLAANEFGFVTVRCISTQIKPGTYTVTLTLKDTDANTSVAPQTFIATLIVSV